VVNGVASVQNHLHEGRTDANHCTKGTTIGKSEFTNEFEGKTNTV
jgi:hypothetical protein